jgi:hypothetical protein
LYVESEFGGALPRFHRGYDQRPCELVKRHGGTDGVARYLHTTPESLVPFLIVIDALRLFRRDCVGFQPVIRHTAPAVMRPSDGR